MEDGHARSGGPESGSGASQWGPHLKMTRGVALDDLCSKLELVTTGEDEA